MQGLYVDGNELALSSRSVSLSVARDDLVVLRERLALVLQPALEERVRARWRSSATRCVGVLVEVGDVRLLAIASCTTMYRAVGLVDVLREVAGVELVEHGA